MIKARHVLIGAVWTFCFCGFGSVIFWEVKQSIPGYLWVVGANSLIAVYGVTLLAVWQPILRPIGFSRLAFAFFLGTVIGGLLSLLPNLLYIFGDRSGLFLPSDQNRELFYSWMLATRFVCPVFCGIAMWNSTVADRMCDAQRKAHVCARATPILIFVLVLTAYRLYVDHLFLRRSFWIDEAKVANAGY